MADESATLASNWMSVDLFRVQQAAALWVGIDPTSISEVDLLDPSEYVAIKQMLTAAIITGELPADTSTNALRIIGDHSASLVSRTNLEEFARKRDKFPDFLFNTLAPFQPSESPIGFRTANAGHRPGPPQPSTPINRGGRPPQYDWDTFLMEVIRRANLPDGLPEKQADLIREMLTWFQTKIGHEPAESAVKRRISKIYSYLAQAKNQTE